MNKIPINAEIDYDVIVGGDWKALLSRVQDSHKKVLIIAPSAIADSAKLKKYCKNSETFFF